MVMLVNYEVAPMFVLIAGIEVFKCREADSRTSCWSRAGREVLHKIGEMISDLDLPCFDSCQARISRCCMGLMFSRLALFCGNTGCLPQGRRRNISHQCAWASHPQSSQHLLPFGIMKHVLI